MARSGRVQLGVGWLAIPPAIFLIAFFVVPVALMVLRAFSEPVWGLDTFARVMESRALRISLANSFSICATAALWVLVLGSILLIALERYGRKSRAVIFVCLLLPFVSSGELVRIISWIIFLSPNSWFVLALKSAGILSPGRPLMPSRLAVVIGLVHILLPFFTLTAFAALAQGRVRLNDAAQSLGAPPLQSFLSVRLPLIFPALAASTLLCFVIALGYYATPAALGGAKAVVAPALIVTSAQGMGDWSGAAAMGVVLFVLALITIAIMLRFGGLNTIFGETRGTTLRRRGAVSAIWTSAATNSCVTLVLDRTTTNWLITAIAKLLLAISTVLVCFYLAIPTIISVSASVSESSQLSFPPRGFTLQWYRDFFDQPAWREGAWISLRIGVMSSLFAVLLGLAAAFALSRAHFSGKRLFFALTLMPLLMPWIITALGLFFLMNSLGVGYGATSLVVGHTVAAIPYAVLVLSAALTNVDWMVDRAAQCSGAGWRRRFADVVLPVLKPALFAAFIFTFIASFTEISFAFLMSGPRFATLPVVMWQGLTFSLSPTVAAAGGVLTLVSCGLFVVYAISRRGRLSGRS